MLMNSPDRKKKKEYAKSRRKSGLKEIIDKKKLLKMLSGEKKVRERVLMNERGKEEKLLMSRKVKVHNEKTQKIYC